MSELIRLYAQIAVLRRGPQDLPASIALLAITVLGYFGVIAVLGLVLPLRGPWLVHLVFDCAFVLLWYQVLLRVLGRQERFLQTATAVFGLQAVLAPPLLIFFWIASLMPDDDVWKLPVVMLALVVVIWLVTASSHVLKAALEWSLPPCVALVILQLLAGELLIDYLFPGSPTP